MTGTADIDPHAAAASQLDAENPWPGLAAFEEADARFFHGREESIDALLRLVVREDLVLLYGPSGLGKTSLLRAGLFPKLPTSILPVYIRLHYGGVGASGTAVDPRHQVLEAVTKAAAARGVEVPRQAPSATLWEYFRRRDEAFWGPGNELVVPLLVFDQFEQLFTRDPKSGVQQSDIEEFIDDLGDLVNGRMPAWLSSRVGAPKTQERFIFESSPCKVIVSFREEYLADVRGLERLVAVSRNAWRLEPMRWNDAVRAVRRAGARVLAPLPQGAREGEPDDSVAAAIADVVSGQAGARGRTIVDPSLLSVFCLELNEKRKKRPEHGEPPVIDVPLVQGSEASEIIAGFYHRAISDLPPEAAAPVQRLIEQELIRQSPRTGDWFRDSVAFEQIDQPGPRRDALLTLIDKWRILRVESVGDRRRLELTHDVLVKPVLTDRLAYEQTVRVAEQLLAERKREEALAAGLELTRTRQTVRQQTWFITVAVVLAGIAAAGWAIAFNRGRAAAQQRAAAESRLLDRTILDAIDMARGGGTGEGLAQAAALMRTHPDNESVRSLTLDMLLGRAWPLPVADTRQNAPALWADFSPDGSTALTIWNTSIGRLWHPETGTTIAELVHEQPISSAAYSHDGRWIATTALDGKATIWNARTGARVADLTHQAEAMSVEFSLAGDSVLTTAGEGEAAIWSTATWSRGPSLKHQMPVRVAHFSPSSRQVITAAGSDAVVWDAQSGRRLFVLGHKSSVVNAAFNPNGRSIVTATVDGVLRLWPAGAASAPLVMFHQRDPAEWMQFSADGGRLLSIDGLVVHVWDLGQVEERARGGAVVPMRDFEHKDTVTSASFSATSNDVITASRDGLARVWSGETGSLAFAPLSLAREGASARFDHASQRIITADREGVSTIWQIQSASSRPVPLEAGTPAVTAAFSSDGRRVIAGVPDGRGLVWDLGHGDSRQVLRLGYNPSLALVEPGPGNRLVAAKDRTVYLWKMDGDQWTEQARNNLDSQVSSVRFDGQGARVVIGCSDGSVLVWNTEARATTKTAESHAADVLYVDFSADGRAIVSASKDKSARVWDVATGQALGPPLLHGGSVFSARFSSKADRIVTASADGKARIWLIAGTQPASTLDHTGPVVWAVFSPDDARVLSAAEDGTLRIWDAATGALAARQLVHRARISAGALSRDGTRVVTASSDGIVRLSDARTGQPLSHDINVGSRVNSVRFDSTGTRVVVASDGQSVLVFDWPRTTASDAEWLARLAEVIGGTQMGASGTPNPLPNWIAAARTLREQARRPVDTEPVSFEQRVQRWLFAPVESRGPSPFIAMAAK